MGRCFFILVVLLFSACAKNPTTGRMDLVFMTEEEEYEIGNDVASHNIRGFGLYKEKEALNQYVEELGQQLVNVSGRSNKPFEFIMLDSGQFNAWAIPGYVNVYRGVLPYLNSEAELAFIVGHETGHIAARHTVRGDALEKLGHGALIIGTGLLAAAIDNSGDSEAQKKRALKGAVTAGLFVSQVGFAKHNRFHENEADDLGLQYMEALGYDPREAVNVHMSLARNRDMMKKIYHSFYPNQNEDSFLETEYYDLLASHPNPEDRMKNTIKKVGGLLSSYRSPSRDKYLSMINGMAYGPNFASYGAVGERMFYNPRKRVAFELPKGFYTTLMQDTWVGVNPNKNAYMSFHVRGTKFGEDAEEALRADFPKLRNVEKVELNGFHVYTGVQDIYKKTAFLQNELIGKQRVFGLKAVTSREEKSGGNIDDDVPFYALTFKTNTHDFDLMDDSFFKSVKSFKYLSRQKADQLEPLRLQIHTVKKGDSIDSLSDKMAFGAFKKEWFLLLNNLSELDTLTTGDKVKLVVDLNVNKI